MTSRVSTPIAARLKAIEETVKAFNERNWDDYLSHFSQSVVTYEPDEPEFIVGLSGLKNRLATYTRAFPDVRLEAERLFGEDDLVCLNSLWIGTHKGPLPGPRGKVIEPSNKRVRVHGCSVFRFKDERIIEFYGYYDQLELLGQVGAAL